MLIIENNSVYEIDEECMRKKKVPKECETARMLQREQNNAKNERKK